MDCKKKSYLNLNTCGLLQIQTLKIFHFIVKEWFNKYSLSSLNTSKHFHCKYNTLCIFSIYRCVYSATFGMLILLCEFLLPLCFLRGHTEDSSYNTRGQLQQTSPFFKYIIKSVIKQFALKIQTPGLTELYRHVFNSVVLYLIL